MAVSKSVRRLLRVLNLEEELRRRELESAQAEHARLNVALTDAIRRERDGRLLFTDGVCREDLDVRWMGLKEEDVGRRKGAVLQRPIQQSEQAVETLRAALLEKRVERKQAETLVRAAEARELLEEDRRTQQGLDSWYLMRKTCGNDGVKGKGLGEVDESKSPDLASSKT